MNITRAEYLEYLAGRKSGSFHNPSDPLHRDNCRKMQSALENENTPALVRQYWLGYRDEIQSKNNTPGALNLGPL